MTKAQNYLGWCYETGTGVVEDEKQAVVYYQKAARQGNNSAQTSLKRLSVSVSEVNHSRYPKSPT